MSLDLPPNAGSERDAALLHRVTEGAYDPIQWATVTSSYAGHQGEFQVFADALKMDGVRINCSAQVEQLIADSLECLLLTPMLADMIWQQRAVTLLPSPQTIDSSTQAMVDHSARLDAQLAKLGDPTGLIATVGKHWVIDDAMLAHPGMAENYGWHFEGPSFQGMTGEVATSLVKDPTGQYVRLIQGRGWRHDQHHQDYSQTCVLVARACLVNGQPTDLKQVLTDAKLAGLASHHGAMQVLRQPGVQEMETSGGVVVP
jgi:hypothetical protein